jgi:MYXO-CTERM domain-containing protein
MKSNRLRSNPASIAKTRWAPYAAAGAATALAGSNCAEADIHYSGIVNVHFPPLKHRLIAFPLDQTGDSLVFEHTAGTFGCYEALFSINGIVSAAFRGYFPFVSKLSFGQNISTGEFVTASHGIMALLHTCYTYGTPWEDAGTGYVGFRFNNGAGIQYGWARVTTTGEFEGNGFRVVAYAYADPGEPIRAGQRSSSDEQAPDEGSLGWLALGAAGLLAWRKSRSRSARLEDA